MNLLFPRSVKPVFSNIGFDYSFFNVFPPLIKRLSNDNVNTCSFCLQKKRKKKERKKRDYISRALN